MSREAEQVLRYAADLARLYAQASTDRRRLERIERALTRVQQASLALARALSPEEAAERLAEACADLLGLEGAAVYLRSETRLEQVAGLPAAASWPRVAPVGPERLERLSGPTEHGSEPWIRLGLGGERVVALPLPGRRRPVGLVVGPGRLPPAFEEASGVEAALLALLSAHGGAALENLRLEERRSRPMLLRPQGRGAPPAAAAGEGEGQALLGESAAMQKVRRLIERLARVDSTVLLQGETGTGKSLVARALHDASGRRAGPFVTLNCGAIPEALVESELFGHEAGAFTGADRQHKGKVELAKGGTLFLDEVAELPLAVQTKLLTFLEDRRFTRVGGEKELEADVRVVSATNRDLERAVAEGAFRSDLLYRLNVFTVALPPLRERGGDVVELALALAGEVARRYGLPVPRFAPESAARLRAYPWPGNVRELRNVVEKAVILADDEVIPPELLPEPSASAPPRAADPGRDPAPRGEPARAAEPAPLGDASFAEAKARMIAEWELGYLEGLLRATEGNVSAAARLAQLDKTNLRRKLKKYGLSGAALRDED